MNEVSNYRGISFMDCIAKLFTGLLLSRLNSWINENMVLNECQAGFRRGYSTTDNIFNLLSIIKLQTRIKRKKLYCLFIDFKAAFDSPSRSSLFYKLYLCGVSSKFINTLQALYRHTEASVWTGKGITRAFGTSVGVRQGCLLSPALFSLFLNDLSEFINGGVRVGGLLFVV